MVGELDLGKVGSSNGSTVGVETKAVGGIGPGFVPLNKL